MFRNFGATILLQKKRIVPKVKCLKKKGAAAFTECENNHERFIFSSNFENLFYFESENPSK